MLYLVLINTFPRILYCVDTAVRNVLSFILYKIRTFHHFHDDDVGFDDVPTEVAVVVLVVARRTPPAFPPGSAFDCQDSFLTMVAAISMMMVMMMSGQKASSCCCFPPDVVVVRNPQQQQQQLTFDGNKQQHPPGNNNKKLPVGVPEADINYTPAASSWSSPPPTPSMFCVLLSLCSLETRRRREGCGTYNMIPRSIRRYPNYRTHTHPPRILFRCFNVFYSFFGRFHVFSQFFPFFPPHLSV